METNKIKTYEEIARQLELYRKASQGGAFTLLLETGLPLLYANDIHFSITGYKFNNKYEQKVERIIHPDDLDDFIEYMQRAVEQHSDSIETELRIVTKLGEVRWVNVRGSFERHDDGKIYLNGIIIDVTEQHELREKVVGFEEMFKIALKNLQMCVWEYDIDKRSMTRVYSAEQFKFLPEIIENVPQSILDWNFIISDSREDFANIFAEFNETQKLVSVDTKISFVESIVKWERVTLAPIVNQSGIVKKGIFISENITAQKEAEINYKRRLEAKDNFSEGFVLGSRSNLSKNVVEFVQVVDPCFDIIKAGVTYDDMFAAKVGFVADAEDRERYINLCSRAALQKAFLENRTNLSLEYRYKGKDGKICWASVNVHLLRDGKCGDIYVYKNIRDISKQKSIELSLYQRAQRDVLTDAYERDTALDMIEDVIEETCKNNERSALLLFNIDNFTKTVHKAGYDVADNVVKELYAAINSELDDPKIIGRLVDDEFVVWGCIGCKVSQVYEKAERIRYAVNHSRVVPFGLDCSVSVGIAVNENAKYTKSELLDKAQSALTVCWEMGGNCCITFDDKKDVDDYVNVKNTFNIGDTLVKSVMALNSNEDSYRTTRDILNNLAKHYGAQCACLIELDVYKGSLKEVYNCCGNIKCADLSKEEIYTKILRILHDKQRIFVKGSKSDEEVCEDTFARLHEDGLYGVYTSVLESEGKTVGYLSMANPSKNRRDVMLFESIACILANDIIKRQNKEYQDYIKYHDDLTGLLNRNSYVDFVAGFSPDSTSSMGVLVADINGLRQINFVYGRERGDALVAFVGEVLESIPDSKAFRMSGDEFVLIGENLTLEAFQDRVKKVEALLDERYKDSVSTAYVWANGDINPDQLIVQADEKMLLIKQMFYRERERVTRYHDPHAERILIDDIKKGRYEMYLQPKAIVTTGEISGAEALVRYRDINGELVPPVRFIPQLEQTGDVYHIDLFIFEEVCKTISRWQKENRKLIPISLNFSRITLLQDRLISTIEDIYSHYNVPKHLIEIEVAESMGSVERQSLINISADIVKNGYRLSLDDFGSKYSNMSILSVLSLHVLKLDKSLVNDLLSNNNTRAVLKNFMLTCKDLGITSVAEGVETKEQLDILRELNCDYAQGYYFNKPIPCADFEKLYIK